MPQTCSGPTLLLHFYLMSGLGSGGVGGGGSDGSEGERGLLHLAALEAGELTVVPPLCRHRVRTGGEPKIKT